jgi:hypothetical protein
MKAMLSWNVLSQLGCGLFVAVVAADCLGASAPNDQGLPGVFELRKAPSGRVVREAESCLSRIYREPPMVRVLPVEVTGNSVTLRWETDCQEIPNYEVQVVRGGDLGTKVDPARVDWRLSKPVATGSPKPGYAYPLGTPGVYVWRVRPVGGSGKPGVPSVPGVFAFGKGAPPPPHVSNTNIVDKIRSLFRRNSGNR